MNRQDIYGWMRKAWGVGRAAAVVLFALALCGCASFKAERNGKLFPSTQAMVCGGDDMSFLPAAFAMTGYCYEPTQFVMYPLGLVCHFAEAFTLAPAVDIVCLPYDLVHHPSYLAKERLRKETVTARQMVAWKLDEALADPRYLAPTNTLQREILSKSLYENHGEFLTREQTEKLFAAIIADPDLMPVLGGVAGAEKMDSGELNLFVESAIRMRESGSQEDADRLVKAICRSPNLTDEQYIRLLEADFLKPMLESPL